MAMAGVGQVRAGQTEPPALGSPDFAPSADQPVGWRGDGNGRYPAADPPVAWGRLSKAVKDLAAQARKPKVDDMGTPMPEGVIRDWLTLGPVPIPPGKAAKDDFGTDEATLAPDEGDPRGNLAWKAVKTDTSWVDFRPMCEKTVPDAQGHVAYAHAWLHSAEGEPVFLNMMLSGTGKAWLNGKDLGFFNANGSRVKLPLAKGWNRLLLRVAPIADTGWSKGVVEWHFGAAFFGTEASACESKNILWSTPMPDNGPGVSSPILVGGKLFMQAEAGALVCVDARDGKVLWTRSSTFADAATPEERKAHPDVFAEADALSAKVGESLKAYADAPAKYLADAKARDGRIADERKIGKLMKQVDPEKYAAQSGSEVGESAPTPASDGRLVYALFGSGLVACFDLDGNRKWTTVVDARHQEHGYAASPCLVVDRLVIKAAGYLGAVALDGETGKVVTPMPLWKTKGLHSMTAPLALVLGGEKLVVQSFGVITRLSDGKVLAKAFAPPYYNVADYVSPTIEGRVLCSNILAKADGGMRFAFETLPDAVADPLVMKNTKQCEYDLKAFPTWFAYNHVASPLLFEGLAYVVSCDGVLTVIDAAKGEVVYQRMLDGSPLMTHTGSPIRGGCGASPTLAGKYIYLWDNQGTALVIEPGRTYKQVARNRVEQIFLRWGPERNECTVSCPVFSGRRLFYRGEINLYCIGESGR
jgi:outer membrane protein assembly factor BamB